MQAIYQDVSRTFNRCAPTYEQAAKVSREIGERLFERLTYLNMSPKTILDLGCATGVFSQQLKKRYPKAQVIGVDIARKMLKEAKLKQTWRRKWPLVCADMHKLPFADGLFDLVFANQVLHWSTNLKAVLHELNRVMRPEGCLMFTLLGLDTYREWQAFFLEDKPIKSHEVFDMHPVGDMLLQEQFLDPVMDTHALCVHYASLDAVIQGLRQQGIRNLHPERQRGLMSKARWSTLSQQLLLTRVPSGKFPLTYEVIYGHAWKGAVRSTTRGHETFIPVSSLRTAR